MAPEHPDVMRLAAGTEHEQAVRDYVNHALNETNEERGNAEKPKTGVALGRTVDQPRQRRADPDVRRRLRADGVRHRRDHGGAGARRARLRLRAGLRPADPARDRRPGQRGAGRRPEAADEEGLPYTGDGPLVNSRPDFDGMGNREALDARSWRGWTARARATRRSTTACATGWSPAALLGLPDPDRLLRALRHGARARASELPVELPDIEDYTPKGRSPLAAAEDWVRHELPGVRRAGAPGDGHDGHVRRLLLVLPALLRRAQRRGRLGPGGAARVDAGRPVHRRRRARDPAPDVRALLHARRSPTSATSTSRSRSARCSRRGW